MLCAARSPQHKRARTGFPALRLQQEEVLRAVHWMRLFSACTRSMPVCRMEHAESDQIQPLRQCCVCSGQVLQRANDSAEGVQQLRAVTTARMARMQVPVEEWRARLWQDALEASGVQDSSLGAQLQAHFTQQRSTGFVFDERATVRRAKLTLTACIQGLICLQPAQSWMCLRSCCDECIMCLWRYAPC